MAWREGVVRATALHIRHLLKEYNRLQTRLRIHAWNKARPKPLKR